MIDTIKLKITSDPYLISQIKGKSLNQTVRKGKDGYEKATYYDKVLVDQYVGMINLSITKPFMSESMYVEFSVPKLVFGYNIHLFYPNDLEEVIFNIQVALEKKYEVELPSFNEWIVQRLDICYVWKLETNEMAHDVLVSLRTFEFPRKKMAIYKTTNSNFSDTSSIKSYLKKDEFFDTEYKLVKKVSPKRAEFLLDLADGSFRFEVEYRKKKLTSYFKKKDVLLSDVVDLKVLQTILKKDLKTLLQGFNPEIIEDRAVALLLIDKYGDKLGFHLLTFYFTYFRRRSLTLLKSLFPKPRIKRYLKQIADAGVGLISDNKDIRVELKIPSDLAPNQKNDQVAIAPDQFDSIQQELFSVRHYYESDV